MQLLLHLVFSLNFCVPLHARRIFFPVTAYNARPLLRISSNTIALRAHQNKHTTYAFLHMWSGFDGELAHSPEWEEPRLDEQPANTVQFYEKGWGKTTIR